MSSSYPSKSYVLDHLESIDMHVEKWFLKLVKSESCGHVGNYYFFYAFPNIDCGEIETPHPEYSFAEDIWFTKKQNISI